MQTMSLQQAAVITKGHLVGENVSFNAISTDTRKIQQGDLFVALQGENFDANDFVEQANKNGAVAAIVSAEISVDMPYVRVDDTLLALTQIAKEQRKVLDIPLVAITGSNGKTSVKEMLASILSGSNKVLATEGNLNNQIGVPLTLLRLTDEHDVAVIEMGASHSGDIAHLCDIAAPTVAILNNVGSAHLEGFGSIQGVANAKGEIVSGVSETGTAILNQEEPWLDQWLALLGNRRVIRFGWSDNADVWADIESVQTGIFNGQFKTTFVLHYQQEQVEIQLNLIGTHNVLNALAAASAAISLGESLTDIKEGLERLMVVKGRMQSLKGVNNSVVINDCYNANPKSFEAAMACLKNIQQPVWLVLGDFAELGTESMQIHRQLGADIETSHVERFYAVGEQMKVAVNEFNKHSKSPNRQAVHFSTKDALAVHLEHELSADTVILLKGSRSQGLETIVEKITLKEDSVCC